MKKILLLSILGAFLCGNAMAIALDHQPADEHVADAQVQNVAHIITTLPWDCERYDELPDLVDTPDAFQAVDIAIGDICETFRDLIAQSPRGADLYRGVFDVQIELLADLIDCCVAVLDVLLPGTNAYNSLAQCIDVWEVALFPAMSNAEANVQPGGFIQLDQNVMHQLHQLIHTIGSVSGAVLAELHDFTREKNFPEGNGVSLHSVSFFADELNVLYGGRAVDD